MRARTYAILISCLLTLCEPGSAGAVSGDNMLASIQSCLTRLQAPGRKLHSGDTVVLSERCPELSLSLDNPALAQLEPALQDITSIRQLRDVRRSLQTRQSRPTTTRAPSIADVSHILAQVYHPDKQAKPKQNLFERVMQWLDHKIQAFLKRHHSLIDNFHIDRKTGLVLIKGILSTVLVLLVTLVLYIIVSEMRATGLLATLRRRRDRQPASGDIAFAERPGTPGGIDTIKSLPLNQQVPSLLQYALHQLIAKKLLPGRYNLTNREFAGLLHKREPYAALDFEQLVRSSDRVVYGKQTISEADTAPLYDCVTNIEKLPAGELQ